MRQALLRLRLAKYIKDKRGKESLRSFSKRYHLSKDTIFRIEKQEQNVTIDTLENLCRTFRCDIRDLFPT